MATETKAKTALSWAPKVAVAIALNTTPVYAQGATDGADTRSLLNMSLEELLEVQVSVATRSKQAKTDAPSIVTAFSAKDIKRLGVRTLEELLNFVPGVYSNRADVAGRNPVFRGRRTTDSAVDVLVLLDGMRINDPVSGGAFYGLPDIALRFVESVEIIRGPASALYGSNAQSGVISIKTRKTGSEVLASIGINGEKEAGFLWSNTFGDISVSTTGHYYDYGGETYAPFVEFFGTQQETQDPMHAVDMRLSISHKNTTLNTSYYKRHKGGFLSGGGLNQTRSDLRMLTENIFVDLRQKWRAGENLNTEFYAGYHHMVSDLRTTLAPASIASALFWTNGADVDFIGGNYRTASKARVGFDGTWAFSEQNTLSFGFSVGREETNRNSFQGNFDGQATIDSEGADFIPLESGGNFIGFWGGPGAPWNGSEIFLIDDYARNVLGTYLQFEMEVASNLSLTTGLRFDTFEKAGSKLTARGGLVYNPDDKTTLRALFGQAFRAPTIFEQKSEISTSSVGNPNLAPETNNSFELSASRRMGTLQISATYFANHVSDGIKSVLVDDVIDGFNAFQSRNVVNQKYRGIETELKGRLNENLDLTAGFTHLFKADKIGVATNLFFGSANFTYDSWNLNINTAHRGKINTAPAGQPSATSNSYLPSFWDISARLGYTINETTEAYVSANNLLNETILSYSDTAILEMGLPNPGTHIRVGLNHSF